LVTTSQSDESQILKRIAVNCPKTFVEFGFHPTEYNCIDLKEFKGLLVDGDKETVKLANSLLSKQIEALNVFVTLENINIITDRFPQLGVLSIDIDSNDYWILEALLPIGPHVIAVEYNASFGLNSITVPYDPDFERHAKHSSGWYHGASIIALTKLCERYGYKLVAVASAGGNAFFAQTASGLPALDPLTAYRENSLRNRWSKTTASEQWARIKDMAYVTV
jgi:hypothetical protein